MISGQDILLSPFEEKHAQASYNWFNDPYLARLLDRAKPVSPEEHRRWFESLPRRTDLVMFAIEQKSNRRHIGNIWLADIDKRNKKAELRVAIGDEAGRGRGLGTQAISLLAEYAFGQINLHRVYAFVLDINPRAKHAFEKAGFVLEGVLKADRWAGDTPVDAYLLAKLSGSLSGKPASRSSSPAQAGIP